MNVQSCYAVTIYVCLHTAFSERLLKSRTDEVFLFLIRLILLLPVITRENWLPVLCVITVFTVSDFFLAAAQNKNNGTAYFLILLGSIVFAVLLMNTVYFTTKLPSVTLRIIGFVIHAFYLDPEFAGTLFAKLLLCTSGALLVCVESNHLIVGLLRNYAGLFEKNADGVKGMGKQIGYLERAIIYVLILSGNMGAIAFVIAAKTLARFKELEDRTFAEYFLVGTLSSVVLSMVLSLAVRSLIGMC